MPLLLPQSNGLSPSSSVLLAAVLSWILIKEYPLKSEGFLLNEFHVVSWPGQSESHWQAQTGRVQLVIIWFYRCPSLLSFFEEDSTFVCENPWSHIPTVSQAKEQLTDNVFIVMKVTERCSRCIIEAISELLLLLHCLIV